MDGVHHIGVGVNVIFDAGDRLRVGKEPRHLLLGAAVAEFQVVQHRVVLLGKALVGVLDGRHVAAHLVGVVRHIGDCHVGVFHGLFRIAAQGGDQACGEAGDSLHIVVRRHPRRLVGVRRVLLHCLRGILEQGVDAADQLLVVRVGGDDFLAELHGGGSGGHNDRAHRRADRL